MKEVIYSILEEKLTGFVYEAEAAEEMAMGIAKVVRDKMTGLYVCLYLVVVFI